MNDADIAAIADWIVQRGLAGDDEIALLHGFCERCVAGLADHARHSDHRHAASGL